MSSAQHDHEIDIDSTLASLFFLREANENIALPRPDALVNTSSSTRRLLSVATSIAAICVRKPEGEVFACSLAISQGSLEIYLAENHPIDPATCAYLDGILTRLVDISEEQRNTSSPVDVDSFSQDVRDTLEVVLQFTFPNFLHSISRHDTGWDTRMAEIEKLDLTVEERSAFEELKQNIEDVLLVAQVYASQPSDQMLGHLCTSLICLRAFVLETPDKDIAATILRRVDTTFPLPLTTEAMMAEDLEAADMSQGFSLTRYIARMLSSLFHVMKLVRLGRSSTYKDLFSRSRRPVIHYLTPVPKSVVINTGAALQFLDNSLNKSSNESALSLPSATFLSINETVHQIEECPHAELTLFRHLLLDALQGAPGGLSAYWVIGTSQLMCAGCYATIARAYPKILRDAKSQLRTLKPFLVSGSHGKFYTPWIPATLSDLDELVGLDFDSRLKNATLGILKDDLLALVNSRRIVDSSSGWDTAEGEMMRGFKTEKERLDNKQFFAELRANYNPRNAP